MTVDWVWLVALFPALILTLLIATLGRVRGTWLPFGRAASIFVLVWLAGWAGGLWLVPFGPMAFGVPWAPVVVVAFIVAAIAGVWTVPQDFLPTTPEEAVEPGHGGLAALAAFTNFFWILALLLTLVVITGYFV